MLTPDDLRSLLQARYNIDEASPADRPALQQRFDALLDTVLAETSVSRYALLEALSHRYKAFRRTQRSPEQK